MKKNRYKKKSLIYQKYIYDLFSYLLEHKKKQYSYADIKQYVNQNTWETKIKKFFIGKEAIKGEKKGRVHYFYFTERKFIDYLFDNFIKYLVDRLIEIYSEFKYGYDTMQKDTIAITKKIKYKKDKLDKEDVPILSYIAFLKGCSKLTLQRMNRINKYLGISKPKISEMNIPNKDKFMVFNGKEKPDGIKRIITLNFFKKIYQIPQLNIFGNLLQDRKMTKMEKRRRLYEKIEDLIKNNYPTILKDFRYAFFQNLNSDNKFNAFCDVFDEIIHYWSLDMEEFFQNMSYSKKELENKFLVKNKESIKIILNQLCFVIDNRK